MGVTCADRLAAPHRPRRARRWWLWAARRAANVNSGCKYCIGLAPAPAPTHPLNGGRELAREAAIYQLLERDAHDVVRLHGDVL